MEDHADDLIEKCKGDMEQLDYINKICTCIANSMAGEKEGSGANTQRFKKMRAKLQQGLRRVVELSSSGLNPLLETDLSEFLQLLLGCNGSFTEKVWWPAEGFEGN